MPSKKKVVEAKPVCKAKIIYVIQEFEGWDWEEDQEDEDSWYNRTRMQRLSAKTGRFIGEETWTMFRTRLEAERYMNKLQRAEGGRFRVGEIVLV